jgi:Na+-driven multidrug efflux pump
VIPDSIVKAHHDTRSTMWAGIWSNLINVALNTLFTFVFQWGVFGIALSTVLGRFGGLAYALDRARRHERRRISEGGDGAPGVDPRPYRSILGLATPAAVTFALTAVETALVNAFLAREAVATAAIAAFSVYYRVALFALNPVIALAVAMLPYAARMHGARNVPALVRGLRESLGASAVYAIAIVGPVCVGLADVIARSIAESPQTASFAALLLRLVPIMCLASAPFLLCRPLFEGMGRGRPGLGMAVLRYAVLLPAFLWLGIRAADRLQWPALYGVTAGSLAATALTSAVFVVWTRRVLFDLHAGGSSRA